MQDRRGKREMAMEVLKQLAKENRKQRFPKTHPSLSLDMPSETAPTRRNLSRQESDGEVASEVLSGLRPLEKLRSFKSIERQLKGIDWNLVELRMQFQRLSRDFESFQAQPRNPRRPST